LCLEKRQIAASLTYRCASQEGLMGYGPVNSYHVYWFKSSSTGKDYVGATDDIQSLFRNRVARNREQG
jgi:hypothetical protein